MACDGTFLHEMFEMGCEVQTQRGKKDRGDEDEEDEELCKEARRKWEIPDAD